MTSPAGLLLTPGANGGPDHPTLLAVEAGAGLPVRRRRLPRTAAAAVADVCRLAQEWASELGVDPSRLVLGGRSFGGRVASMAVAAGQPAAGLVLLSYPLHPPGQPDRLRVAHLTDVSVPVLAISGTTDPFGTPEELAAHLPAQTRLVLVPGAHNPPGAASIAAVVADWLTTLA